MDKFIAQNKAALVSGFKDYFDSMVEAKQYDEIEDFSEWVAGEYEAYNVHHAKGTPLAEYV